MFSPVFAALLTMAPSVMQASESYRCDYATRNECGPGGPCVEFQSPEPYLLVPSLEVLQNRIESLGRPPAVVQRCDQKGCTEVEVWSRRNGAFINIWSTNGLFMMKMWAPWSESVLFEYETGDFIEVATSFLGALVSFGHCPGWEVP